MTGATSTDEAYDLLLSIVMVEDDVLELVRMLVHSAVDPADLLDRFRDEHVWNGAGRIEGRVFEEGGRWIADPRGLGLTGRRAFGFESAAHRWIQRGGAYADDHPCWHCGYQLAPYHQVAGDGPQPKHSFQPAIAVPR